MRKKYTMITIKKFVVLSALVFGFALIVSIFSFVDQARAECPPVAWVCEYWGDYLGVEAVSTGSWCEGEECIESWNYGEGEQIRFSADDEQGIFPLNWHVRYNGIITNLSCSQIIPGVDTKKWNSDTVVMHERHHCTIVFDAENDVTYLEFIASNPNTGCLGWVECKIIGE